MLNDLKKLLFGAKSVAKSGARKAAEAGKEAGEELMETGGELLDRAIDKVEDVGDKVVETAGHMYDKAKDATEDITEKIWEEAEKAAQKGKAMVDDVSSKIKKKTSDPLMGEEDDTLKDIEDSILGSDDEKPADSGPKEPSKLKKTAEELGRKVGGTDEVVGGKVLDTAEKVGGKVLDTAEDIGEKLFDVSEKIGGKILERGKEVGGTIKEKFDDLMEKAQKEAEKESMGDIVDKAKKETSKESMDDVFEKARKMSEELEDKVKEADDRLFADKIKETGDSELKKHESFFDKAQKFADGDYHMEGKKLKEGEMEIKKDPDYKPKPPKEGKVLGFDDLDGDGDEIIDDAIIDED